MSDRPDFTANTALNAVADTLDNLPVSINAQSIGSLAVDIAAQSAGEVDINLSTNSAGDIDISFQSQGSGVQSGTEFAAAQAQTVTGTSLQTVSAGSSSFDILFSNTTGNPVVAEFVSGAQRTGFVDAVELSVNIQDATGSQIGGFEANPVNLPLSLDPGIRVPTNGTVNIDITNNASSTVEYAVDFVGREVV